MVPLGVIMDLTECSFACLTSEVRDVLHVTDELEVGRMPVGTKEGRSTVMVKGRAKDGRVVIVEMPLRLLANAVKALQEHDRIHGEDGR